jgi:hypothetical protein
MDTLPGRPAANTGYPIRDGSDASAVRWRLALLLTILLALVLLAGSGAARAATLPDGFQETTAFSGLTNPTTVRFASDGRVFVAEKSGLIKIFHGLADTTPTTFADLRTNVHNF